MVCLRPEQYKNELDDFFVTTHPQQAKAAFIPTWLRGLLGYALSLLACRQAAGAQPLSSGHYDTPPSSLEEATDRP